MVTEEKILQVQEYIEKQKAWIIKALDYEENQSEIIQCKLYAQFDTLRKIESLIKE